MRRFRWTRSKYKHAHHLARLIPRLWNEPRGYLSSDPPLIVQRYFDLWQDYRSHGDPLLVPLHMRYDPEIPF